MTKFLRQNGKLINANVQTVEKQEKVPRKGYVMHKARHNLGPNRAYFADAANPWVFKYDTTAIAEGFEEAMGILKRNKHVKQTGP